MVDSIVLEAKKITPVYSGLIFNLKEKMTNGQYPNNNTVCLSSRSERRGCRNLCLGPSSLPMGQFLLQVHTTILKISFQGKKFHNFLQKSALSNSIEDGL